MRKRFFSIILMIITLLGFNDSIIHTYAETPEKQNISMNEEVDVMLTSEDDCYIAEINDFNSEGIMMLEFSIDESVDFVAFSIRVEVECKYKNEVKYSPTHANTGWMTQTGAGFNKIQGRYKDFLFFRAENVGKMTIKISQGLGGGWISGD